MKTKISNSFIDDSAEVAKSIMAVTHPHLVDSFSTVIRFLALNPEMAPDFSKRKTPPLFGQREYIQECANKFASGRVPKLPKKSQTVPDEMVSVVLHLAFGVPQEHLDAIKSGHRDSMTAENIVGDLLERYIARSLESKEWVWVSGSLIKAVDFIRPPTVEDPLWHALQIKNRDNSENSSSRAIRNGTDIEEWHRTFSKKTGSNWDRFPDTYAQGEFTEDGFREFVTAHLLDLRKII